MCRWYHQFAFQLKVITFAKDVDLSGVIYLSVCLFVSLLATSLKNY